MFRAWSDVNRPPPFLFTKHNFFWSRTYGLYHYLFILYFCNWYNMLLSSYLLNGTVVALIEGRTADQIQAIDPAPGVWFIPNFILLAKVAPGQYNLTAKNHGLKNYLWSLLWLLIIYIDMYVSFPAVVPGCHTLFVHHIAACQVSPHTIVRLSGSTNSMGEWDINRLPPAHQLKHGKDFVSPLLLSLAPQLRMSCMAACLGAPLLFSTKYTWASLGYLPKLECSDVFFVHDSAL